jgi:S-DNA-T family DNA segregation ATPase FtsK/SpoIIIE
MPVVSLLLPAAGQFAITVYMASLGHWFMAVASLPGFAAQAISSLLMLSHATGTDTRRNEVSGSIPSHTLIGSEAAGRADGTPGHPGLPNGDLIEDLGFHSPRISHMWRHIVSLWVNFLKDGAPASREDAACFESPIASTKDGVLKLDLPNDGPHAVVAGTTGSGKSFLLQNWCLCMATRLPPSKLNFVLLDFKGGASFTMLAQLPHTVGCVSDLSLEHAKRALDGLEHELRRRELLLQEHRVPRCQELDEAPPRMVIVVDEFHALRRLLPDAEERMERIAALGRSLDMNLILSTQNPLGQISSQIKANISLRICMRVQDPLQSIEMLGNAAASCIDPAEPGYAYCADGHGVRAFQTSTCRHPRHLIRAIRTAFSFLSLPPPAALFTAPLPRLLDAAAIGCRPSETPPIHGIVIGLEDDGVRTRPCTVLPEEGNLLVIGAPGCGKQALVAHMQRLLGAGAKREVLRLHGRDARTEPLHRACNAGMASVLIVDDAGALMDPLCDRKLREPFISALRSTHVMVICIIDTSGQLRHPEYFPSRIVFPSGDPNSDLLAGIPASYIHAMAPEDVGLPGRGFLIRHTRAIPIQCVTEDPKPP